MANVFPQMDRKKKMLTIISPKEYAVAPSESASATLALITRAKKLLKKITKEPCF